MRIRCLVWIEDFDSDTLTDDSEEEGEEHVVLAPTWKDIWDASARLDGWIYPSVYLYLHERPLTYPCMSIDGGPEEYAVTLTILEDNERCSWKSMHYLDPQRADKLYTNRSLRTVGRAYHNLEIEEVFFTSDRELVVKLIDYFANTGEWHPDVSYVEEIDGKFGWTDVRPTSMRDE